MSSSQSKSERLSTPTTYASFVPSSSLPPQNTSPLLSSTPPTITKALSQAYPFIIVLDHVLGVLTWTSDDVWKSFLVAIVWTGGVLYHEILVRYCGHLMVVAILAAYVYCSRAVELERRTRPTLDSIVHTMSNVTTRASLLVSPISSLNLTVNDVTRLLFTALFMSPIYIIVAFFILSPKTIVLFSGLFVLTYHSVYARVTRAVLWRSRTVRLCIFYLTGINFTASGSSSSGSRAVNKSFSSESLPNIGSLGVQSKDGKPVRFTYVLYENQRRWLGIGWTPNLLAYERAPWTDEFLNESTSPDNFELPEDDSFGVKWRWVDKAWKLDLTNDGALVVPSSRTIGGKSQGKSRSKLATTDPGPNDGWIYYDNTWKKPGTEDTFSKYTRRRRWIRTAELINTQAPGYNSTTPATTISFSNSEKSSSTSAPATTIQDEKSTNTTIKTSTDSTMEEQSKPKESSSPTTAAVGSDTSSTSSRNPSTTETKPLVDKTLLKDADSAVSSSYDSASTSIEKPESVKTRKSLRFAE